MKTLFGMTAAVLLLVSMLFVSLPGTGRAAAGKVTLAEMVKIKKAADEAAQAAKAQVEKAKTAEEKRLAKQLVKQAESNAEVASDLLEAVKAGEEVNREEAEACAAIAKAVHEAAGALAAGNMGKAEGAMGRIGELGSSLPTAANARAEMQRGDGAGKNNPPNVAPPSSGGACIAPQVTANFTGSICKDSSTLYSGQYYYECKSTSWNPWSYTGVWVLVTSGEKQRYALKERNVKVEHVSQSFLLHVGMEDVENARNVKR